MKRKEFNLRTALKSGIIVSMAAAWLAVIVLSVTGSWSSRSAGVVFLILLAAVALTSCVWMIWKLFFLPMDALSDAVSGWDGAELEELERRLSSIPGPLGELGGAFRGRMTEAEHKMVDLEESIREETTEKVQADIADRICESVLPQKLQEYPSRQYFEVAGQVRPGRREHSVFYDFFYIDPGLVCVSVGCVPEQGVYSSIFMANAQSTIRTRLRLGRSLAETMADVNTQLYDYGTKGEMRALVGTLDTSMGFFSYVNAGVCAPMIMRNGERFEDVESAVFTPLGKNQNVSYRAENLRLRQGDRLFLHTEGLETAVNQSGKTFGETELNSALNRSRVKKEPEESLQYLVNEVAAFCPADDAHAGYATLLLEYRKGEKELAHCRVPAAPEYAAEVMDFLKQRFEDNAIQPRHYARVAVLVDELFALCCRSLEDDGELTVECGVAPDAQSVTIRITGSFQGKSPLAEEQTGPSGEAVDFIQNHGDYIRFQPGEEQDAISVVCFL